MTAYSSVLCSWPPLIMRLAKWLWCPLSVAGHFAAWEQPELLAKEVIEFFLVDVGLGSPAPKL